MGLITQLNLLAEEILAVFCSTGLTCNIYFLENAFCMQISSFGYCEATDQQISYPPGLILWFIFLMLLPFLHVSSPESLCPRLCTSCALQAWQEKNLGNQSLWDAGPGGKGHWLCQEEGEKPWMPWNVHIPDFRATQSHKKKHRCLSHSWEEPAACVSCKETQVLGM